MAKARDEKQRVPTCNCVFIEKIMDQSKQPGRYLRNIFHEKLRQAISHRKKDD